MFHRVLVDVIQSREIGLLVSEPRFAEVEPDLPAGRAVELVNPPGGLDVEHAQHVGKVGSIRRIGRRMGDEVVMI